MRRLLVALGLFATALVPPGLSAQERPTSAVQEVERRRVVYRAAKEQYEADEAEVKRIRFDWNQLMDQHSGAHARGDDDDVARLRGQLQELAGDKHRAENARQATREKWFEAGDTLMDVLNDYLGMLDKQIRNSQVGSDDTASTLYDEYEKELRELEQELASVPRELPELVMPEVEIRPEDGPRDIQRKLKLLESREQEFEKLLGVLDREIEGLTLRQARERRRNRGADIFDDNRDPTGVGTDVTGGTGGADTTRVTLAAVKPLGERIAEKKEFREQVNDLLTRLKARVEEVRRMVSGT